MMERSILLPLLMLSVMVGSVFSQSDIGLNPPSKKWYVFHSPTGKVIYPDGLDSIAFRSADIMRYQQINDTSILGAGRIRRVPVILQNGSVLPAGFSTPAPWRNEYYITPPYNLFMGPTDWVSALTVHEYRHAQQFHAARARWGKLYLGLMGGTGWLFNSLLTQPLWFREGDAVLSETIFSNGGRGMLPSFQMQYRALRVQGRRFNYEKAHFGSFRDFVPNPYHLGYHMVTKARRDHGELVWAQVLEDTYRKGFFWPFSRALKKHTGAGTREFYQRTMAELDSLWIPLDSGRSTPGATPVEAELPKMFTSYRYPHYTRNGNVIAHSSGFDRIPAFVVFENGRPKEILKQGIYTEDHSRLVVEEDRLIWAESAFHERWRAVDYSVIKVHDLRSGKTRQLGHRTRWFSPAISPDGTQVVVAETNELNKHRVLLIDAMSGEILRELLPAGDLFRTHFRFTRDGRSILAVIMNKDGNAIARIDVTTGNEEILVPFTDTPVTLPVDDGKYIYFSAGAGGTNNIHALDPATGSIHRVTNERFGAFEPMPSPDATRLLFSSYTVDGYRLMQMPVDPSQWTMVDLDQPSDITFYRSAEAFEGHEDPAATITGSYTPRRFRSLTSGMLRLTGWFPTPNPPEYGLELYTQNVMSTIRGTFGVAYNTNEERMRYSGRLTYAGLYPFIEGEFTHGGRRISTMAISDSITDRNVWTENMVSGGLSFPFRLTQGVHATDLTIGGRVEYFDVTRKDPLDESIGLGRQTFYAWRGDLRFSRLQPQARRHVKPRWGQQITAEWRSSFDEQVMRQFVSGTLYFPGIWRTHSFNVTATGRRENVLHSYRFVDDRLMPPGLSPRPFEEIGSGTINYELPLIYPDLSAGPVMILQRIRLNIFGGHAQARVAAMEQDYTYAGAELMFDLRFLRLFQTTVLLRGTAGVDGDLQPDLPFQFLVTRFELVN